VASKSKRARGVKQRNLAKDFMYWAIAVFIIKLIIIGNIQGGAWLGADGENYLTGLGFIERDGVFSKESILHYWPAGYPIFIYILSLIGKSFVLTTLSVFQSAAYSFSAFLVANELSKTRFVKFSYIVFMFIIFNPTLSLSSMAVGYESLAASGLIISVALILNSLRIGSKNNLQRNLVIFSLVSSLISFFQPRLLLSSAITIFIWLFSSLEKKTAFKYLSISLLILSISPACLILRNHQANGFNAISTNLGVTMNLGAGDNATGAYIKEGYGVPCSTINGNPAQQDSHLVGCVISWYVGHPVKSAELFYNKAKFFWSPWFGPEASGSMARNPWLNINPLKNIATSSPDGNKLVYGVVGKLISYLWIVGGLFFLFLGFLTFWKSGRPERIFAVVAFNYIILNWLVAIGTLGDHRQRLPILGLSLMFQAVGIRKFLAGRKQLLVDIQPLR
jgi:hypothetical protein